MTLIETIDRLVEWLETDVCSQITLKVPDDYKNDADYEVEYVHPAAFPLYVPGKDRLPPSVPAPIPSICAQLMEGEDDLLKGRRQLQIRLCLACWNPGKHGKEIWMPRKNENAPFGYSCYHPDDKSYTRNMDGWRDSFNLTDLVLRELEGTEYIKGLRLVKESGIKFGLFSEEGNIWDYYPYWHDWIRFTLEEGIVIRPPESYKNFL